MRSLTKMSHNGEYPKGGLGLLYRHPSIGGRRDRVVANTEELDCLPFGSVVGCRLEAAKAKVREGRAGNIEPHEEQA
jgi:hypothetical protein